MIASDMEQPLQQIYKYMIETICNGSNSRRANTTLPTSYIS